MTTEHCEDPQRRDPNFPSFQSRSVRVRSETQVVDDLVERETNIQTV